MTHRPIAPRAASSAAVPCVRRKLLRLAAASLLVAGPAASLRAQVDAAAAGGTMPTPDIETSSYTFVGEVNAEGALVRSGPSENDYPVLKLAKGDKLTVVGMRFEWLKVEPPAGSFCLVSQAFVDKRGDGSVGRIINNRATVRIGSAVVQSKHKVPTLLEPGTDVTIVGDVDEYYKIAPPKGVFFYVDKKFVNPVRRVGADAPVPVPTNPSDGTPPAGQTPLSETPPGATPPAGPANVDPLTGQPPAGETATGTGTGTGRPLQASPERFTVTSENGGPTTVPVDVTRIRELQDQLGKLESQYTAASQKELTQQPIDELVKGYTDLLADEKLPPNARRVAEFRANALQLRKETLASFVAARKSQEEAAQRQKELEAEQKELQERVAATEIKRYAAIGRLAPSSLQAGGQPLFRLIDPANSRTILYVRTGELPLAGGLGQFIAIKGKVVQDEAMHLTYVQPTAFDVVDPKQVNNKLFADYVPPSLAATNVAGTTPGGN